MGLESRLYSTLFQKKIKIDSGELWVNPKINLGYLNQRENFEENIKIIDYLSKFVKDLMVMIL